MNFKTTLFLLSLSSVSLWAKPAKTTPAPKTEIKQEEKIDTNNLSLSLGHLFAKNINDMGVIFDINLVIQGLKDASAGLPSPLSESDCIAALHMEKKKAFDVIASKNLKEAEKFLAEESTKKDISSIDNGKILYKILQVGSGDTVQDSGKIALKYKGLFFNGEVFTQSSQDETIEISQLITGLKQAIIGMKEGEKRLIHIHPEKGYGTEGAFPPNSLLSFEIEIIKAKVEETPQTAQEEAPKQELEMQSEIR